MKPLLMLKLQALMRLKILNKLIDEQLIGLYLGHSYYLNKKEAADATSFYINLNVRLT